MKLLYLIVLLAFLTMTVLARHKRRLLLRQSSYNKFMRSMALNYEKAKVETLGAIFKRHVQQLRHTPNKQVELVFLIDSSGSVGSHYFYEEVRFVKNLLADFTVDMNATRVSVITFSSPHKIFRHIDYLSEPSVENHKCRLLQDDIPDVDYAAGGTHTLGAFLEAEKVLRSARADATKAIFLMTDGYSNGGDPRPIAHKLKAQGVRIFTFGIRDGFVWELQDMASEPKNETCYILDSFEEFEALAKRALHTDLQSGTYISQSMSKCSRLCNSGGVCCHQNASCSCGTYAGKYKCLCKPGYYGSGLGKTGCKPCPPGTYKNYTGLGICTPCPDEHQMTLAGADSISLCKCKKGYRNSGSQECTVFRCSKLSPPKHGFFVNNKCNNVFNAACGLKCKSGYELRGSSLRICQEDGQWSGQPAECIMKTCPSLPQPKNGHMICNTDDFSYSTVCRFTCNTGYTLVGSRKRTCLAIAFWTGIATRCREITCPPLVEIKDGVVEPGSCLSSEVVFGTTCKVSCHSGYKLKGPHTKQCTPDGTWMASETGANLCLDESPPLLHCPKDIVISADERESLTPVMWTEPVPIDNSGLRPVLTAEPSVSSGSKFPIGKTTITYKAKDLSSNVVECSFTIQIIDKTPPRIDKCVSPPPIISKAKATTVEFEEPQFSDNSGKPVEVAPSRRLKDLFLMGKTKIVFTAFDSSNNNNSCVVNIEIVPHLCMTPKPPANGNITCKEDKSGVTCQISCEEGYAFADETTTEYSCLFEEGVWMPQENYPFQDCSAVQTPSDVITPASITLTSGVSCKDKQMLSEMVQNLEEEMKNKLNEACEKEISCKLGDLSFVCEDEEGFNKVPQLVSKRRRRSAYSGHKTMLSLKFSLSGSVQKRDSLNDELEIQLTEALTKMLSSMKNRKSQTLEVKGKSVTIDDMLYDINDPEYQCSPGSIVSNRTCVTCPAGTFCSLDQKECGKCPRGTYQNKENQTDCIRCPDDQSTDTDNCKSIQECKAFCKPGSFSSTGLEPCETCHQGFYQSDYAARKCHPCGEGRTTSRRGSVLSNDCSELCPSGHASLTGLSPCYLCPIHAYQPKVGQMGCLKCPRGGHTVKPGAIYLSQCVTTSNSWEIQSDGNLGDLSLSFNRCDFDNPCKNDGICEDKGNLFFSCNCAPGFAGETCEDIVDPCKSSPCLNGGACYPAPNEEFVCECKAGFTGKNCEENIDDCLPQPCENGGVCVDWINSFTCNCQPGFTGFTCGVLLDNCDNNPCLNGGSCFLDASGSKCSCAQGFAGELCEQDLDECLSLPCQNDATCVDYPGGYSCTCILGYNGKDCEDDIDECADNPCTNGGNCVDSVGYFKCDCPSGFTGKRCEQVLSPYYELNFDDPSILDYAQLSIDKPLTAVTASFWMKTTDDDNQGTPFSYAVKDEPDAFTITDYKNLNIYINGEDVSAEVRLNDGNWQHVVFTWSSPRGEWKLYLNALLLDQGYDLSTKRAIPASGTFIIGQEQDEEGGGFSVSESFLGSLTHLNVWDRELPLRDIETLRYSCDGFEGNVIAWTKVQTALKGGLTKSPSTFCNDCPKPEAPVSGSVTFTGVRPNEDVVYSCNQGYNAAGRSEFKCLVTGEWESVPPDCEPVNCGHPGSPNHGYTSGRDFSYGHRVRFFCNRGYELDGPQSLYCDEYGEWDDTIPDCVEIQCQLPLLSVNTIASVSSRFVQPGTLVTFTCTPGNKLLSSHDSSLCQSDGTFDKSVPTCDPEKCPTPPSIDSGEPKEIKEEYGVGETVQYQCFYGFRFSQAAGNRRGSINCLPSGDWEDDLPECEEILCPDPPTILNAEAVGDYRYVDAEVTYQCNPGYEGVGKNAIICLDTQAWTRLRMRCRPIKCQDPPQIPYGSFTGEPYTFKSVVEYQCDQGYVLAGNGKLSCGEDRKWQGETPMCQPVSCGLPVNIDNGRVNYASHLYGDIAEYNCIPGFIISGSSRVTCEANGKWTPNPLCQPLPCPVPPDVLNAVYHSPSQLVFNSTVRYHCNVGHTLQGSSVLVCNENAQWIPSPPVCKKITCPVPIAPNSGFVKAKDISYSGIASYSCDKNFRLVGVDGRICQADGTWSDETPICQATTCQTGDLANGRIDYKDLSIGSIVSYSCNKGYQLVGDGVRRCQFDLTLDGVAPFCNPVDCGSLPIPTNGDIVFSTSNTLFGTIAAFTCHTGYSIDGLDNVYCGSDGKWSGAVSECKPIRCPKILRTIQNGHILGSDLHYKSVLTYHCNEGYTLNGPSNRICQEDGSWDNPAPTCDIITCPPPRLAFGILSSFDNSVGSTVRYSCRGSYRLEGPKERTCLADGNWSGAEPQCLEIRCALPPSVEHTQIELINETAIKYTCDKGYDLQGSNIRVCERDDIWNPGAPQCILSYCKDLSDVALENGQVLFRSAKVGDMVEYDCNPGYKIKGEEKRKCLTSGIWEAEAPTCEKLNCGHPGVVQNGRVVGSDYTYDAIVRFECNTGYTQKGADSARCEETGYWENRYSNCERVYCPDLDSKIENGKAYFDSTAYLSIVEYVCKRGFILNGVKERECLDDGKWSDAEPTCIPIVCPTPEVVQNGILIGGKDAYGYGDEIEYECEIGHYLHGKPTRRCTKEAKWTEWIPKCYDIQCPEPPVLENGDFIGDSANYKSVLKFYCFEGYKLIGDQEITCEADGQWSGSGITPECERVMCGSPPVIDNAYPDQTIYLHYGTLIQYSCITGYTPSGNDLTKCLANATWSEIDFSCTIVSCPPFSKFDIPHGIFEADSFNYKATVDFSCEEGYRLSGDSAVECESSGAWSSALPTCNIIQCLSLGTIDYGSILVDSNDFGSIANISCDLGYILKGSSRLICLSSGFWNDSLPLCEIVSCPVPPEVKNGHLLNSDGPYVFDLRFEYVCNFGYELQGANVLRCTEFGAYDNPAPICQRIACPEVEDLPFGNYEWVNETFILYSCNSGYYLVGVALRECALGGSWSSPAPVCQPVPCPSPPSIDNGKVIGSIFSFGEFVEYRCNKGHNLIGSPTSECQADGTWSEKNAQCLPVNCGEPEDNFQNGYIDGDVYTYLHTIEYVCLPGFELQGHNNRTCRKDGEWSRTTPTCIRQSCSPPEPIPNGSFFGDSYLFESVISYDCFLGFYLVGEQTRTCESSLTWSGSNPVCARISCPPPSDVINGHIDGDSYLYEDVVQISCNRGYRMEGSASRTCQADKSWSGVASVCSKIYCPVPPPQLQNGLSDYEVGTEFVVDDTVTYFCIEGYIMNGTGQKICESSGKWSSNFIQCYAISCPLVSGIDNGAFYSDSPESQFTFGSSLFFSCNQGFSLVGSSSIECQSSGKWSEGIPSCAVIECEKLEIENGFTQLLPDSALDAVFNREKGKLYAGDNVLIQCNIGYEVKGTTNASCSIKGKWKSGFGSCRRIQCPEPTILNGIVREGPFFYTDEIQISCNRGYQLEGAALRTCQADHSWSGVNSVCTKIYCPVPPPQLRNGLNDYESGNVYGVDDTVTYFCAEGHVMNGTGQRICESSGAWATNFLKCYAISCPAVPTFENGVFNSDFPQSPFTYPSSLYFSCNTGFRLDGSSPILCGSSGKWSEAIPWCSIIECETLTVENSVLQLQPDGGLDAVFVREDGKFYAGDNVLVQCNPGYEISGDINAICSVEGLWLTASYCNPVICIAPEIQGAQFSKDSETYKNKIKVSCDEGLDLIGHDELTCGADRNWVERLPRCELLACGSPPKVDNAVLKGESFNLGDVVNYECKAGYELVGNSLLTCGPNNQWLGSYPVCAKLNCGQPVPLPNSYIDVSSTNFQSTATINCLDGYVLEGSSQTACGVNQVWEFDPGSRCTPVECGNPPEIPNGSVVPDGTTFGSVAVYTCDTGHVIEGTSSMYCDSDGQWGYQVPSCSPVSCSSDPTQVAHATYSKTGSFYKDVVQYTCDKGFTFNDLSATTLTCGDMGSWKGKVSDCIVIDCGLPPKYENAISTYKLTTYSSTLSYACILGYESSATKIFTCSDDGIWEGDKFECMKKNCLNYPDLSNGDYTQGNGTLYEDQIFYACFKGYESTGPDHIKCTSEGKWTNPYCAAVDCLDPPEISHGQYQLDSTTYESEAKYLCDAGYVLAGKSTIECLDTGVWSPTQALCKPMNCHDPPVVDNADVRFNTTLYKDIATYSCEVGFTASSSLSLSCGDKGQWIGDVPKCEIVSCPLPVAPVNGFVDYSDTTYSSIAIYSCDVGNKLIGQNSLTCLKNGTWSNEAPKCLALDCSQPESIENGKVTLSGTHFGGWAYYTCLEGYNLEGYHSIMCNENGFWNHSAPKCKIVDCKIPPLIAFGNVDYDKTTFYSKASYNCKNGYSLIGNRDSICQVDGQWSSDEKRECKLITCAHPPLLENGLLVSYSETFGSRAVYRCLSDYKPQTLSILTCGETGTWNGKLQYCNKKQCPKPYEIVNGGFFHDGELSVDTVVSYYCDQGYDLIGSSDIICTDEEVWSPQPPFCNPLTCPLLSAVPFSILSQDQEARFNSIATFKCQEGYQMASQNDPESVEAVFVCGENGQWEGDGFKCSPVTCPFYPPVIDHSKYELTNGNEYNSRAIYTCDIGYIMKNEHSVLCHLDGQWSSSFLPECEIISCGIPPDVEGASYIDNSFTYGSLITYSCNQHYNLVGKNSIRCLSDGSWTPVSFTCNTIKCHTLAVPENGRMLNSLDDISTHGSVVNFACDDGFILIGPMAVTCLKSGEWDLPPPKCQRVNGFCEESISMAHAAPSPPGKFPGDEISVKCKDGFIGAGDMSSRCQHDGSWLIPAGTCQRISCGRPDSYDRRNVRVFGRNFLYGDNVRYMCRYGFSPVHNPPVLECLSTGQWNRNASCIAQCKQKCENGGWCLGLNRCKCMPGWAGFKCHLPICIFPCLHGGQCEGPYKCKCPHGYQGSRCERAICPRQCQNGGRCLRPGKCYCLPGYQGSVCEDRVLPSKG